jgi:hypothetical protein
MIVTPLGHVCVGALVDPALHQLLQHDTVGEDLERAGPEGMKQHFCFCSWAQETATIVEAQPSAEGVTEATVSLRPPTGSLGRMPSSNRIVKLSWCFLNARLPATLQAPPLA